MLNLPEKLANLEREKRSIKVGVVGVGQMGAGVITIISQMKGMKVVAACDIDKRRTLNIFKETGIPPGQVFYSDDPDECNKALEKGMRVATGRAEVIPQLFLLDVVVEATGIPRVGAEVAFAAIRSKKHIVMMNIETDVTVGHILSDLARRSGVVYTVGAGDEPAAIKELYDFATSLGFKVVAAGKGKNNPLNREATPESLKEIARKKGINPKMLCEFVDGSKTMIEMAALANATGLIPDVRGMHGPECEPEEIATVFSLRNQGGILNQEGVVDYALGKIAPGVFVVVTTKNRRLIQDLEYIGMGKGPNYLLYRPYHLVSIEVPLSIARAVIYNEPTLVPLKNPVAETITVAKRDLKKGMTIDGIGRFDIYGLIEKASVARKENLLPLGLAEGAILKTDVRKGDCLTLDQVELEDNLLVNLRKLQDRLFSPKE